MLKMSEKDYMLMLAHLRAVYPEEGCGLLAGQNGRVIHCYPIDNIDKSETNYTMDPKQQIKAFLDIEAKGWELLSIFHSHPKSPATPSATDVTLAYYPEAIYLIASFVDWQQPEVRAFFIDNGRVRETNFKVV